MAQNGKLDLNWKKIIYMEHIWERARQQYLFTHL
jgi:hypothetical protein